MIIPYAEKRPQIDQSCFIAENTVIVGDVKIEADSSVWFGAVIRGDIHSIRIGRFTNIQDNMVIHVTHDKYPTFVGNYVTGGHGAILHGCTVKDKCIIGMGALILDDSVIGEETIVAAGSVVKEHENIPSGVLVAGNPASIKRKLSDRERRAIKQSALNYSNYIKGYKP
ncbi:MAG: gamma carbonic anhydrase family protein [candidate division Zixibacteria bacterium]|nr:gamma carbonic anhydrase family protein [candidate division Zixibacteria bacterium]